METTVVRFRGRILEHEMEKRMEHEMKVNLGIYGGCVGINSLSSPNMKSPHPLPEMLPICFIIVLWEGLMLESGKC